MSFNITCRADSRADLKVEVDRQAEPQLKGRHLTKDVKNAIDILIDAVPEVEGGYLQLTTYGHLGDRGSVVFNLSAHPVE